ncbi:hypothetical protein K505DRAFT_321855 [Melanomma pulvis-pyrius CBS 109.77]|uniref:DUF7907 domain-containing protein n=1 Tax=Melanomma pulvis-pyrius CBS 109.77 TaxID=1314802 RepID=A0A6A6XR99_9PLEO|nr:hypothetical protein K505DRAFT_321855 [Melanomma pulvis-pyrius CBS 109.77]
MKLALPTLALALAATTAAQYYNQSNPFHLVLVSKNKTINGDTLSACHAGAAIESLCLTNSVSVSKPNPIAVGVFYFNTSDQVVTPNATLGAPGILTYVLNANPNIPESVGLYIDLTTNVALPLLYPGDTLSTTLAFDKNELLNIQDYVDDTVNPPVAGDFEAYYRWYSCTTYYSGYEYVTLTWVLGKGKPQNPSCVKVDVKRKFI